MSKSAKRSSEEIGAACEKRSTMDSLQNGVCRSSHKRKRRPSVPGLLVPLFTFVLLAPASIVSDYAAQTQEGVISTREEIARDLALAPCKDGERLNAAKALFLKMGGREDELNVEKLNGVENLILRKKGTSTGTIVVGAHYDKVADGCGAIDNWTGIVALAHIFRGLKDYPIEKSLVFVAFGKEENGLLGSRAMVKAIKKDEVDGYCAMVNIDSLGMGGLGVIENVSSELLIKRAVDLAKRMKLPLGRATLNNADADSSSFVSKKIPAVTITGISNGWERVLHSAADQVKRVDVPSAYAGYRFALALVAELQELPCNAGRK